MPAPSLLRFTPALALFTALATPACLTGTLPSTGADGSVTPGGEGGTPGTEGGTTTHPDAGGHDAGSGTGDATVAPDAAVDPFDANIVTDAPVVIPDAPVADEAGVLSRCSMSATAIACAQQTYTINTAAGSDTAAGTNYPAYARVVHYQVPLGTAPAAGWPVVFIFQASYVSASVTFAASSADSYGLYYQTELVKNLLDAGYAVLAPEALGGGSTYWQTNLTVPPYATNWPSSPDDLLIQAMFTEIGKGTFGPLDGASLYATGLSSGGYMTSRMAVSYQGKFKALAIESGSYATCLSSFCTIPALPSNHPPTLFLHGGQDTVVVPIATEQAYDTALMTAGIPQDLIDDPNSGHQWIPAAPMAVLAWFQKYP
jgi:poly(3-hydroxybutyrate) depolymerase